MFAMKTILLTLACFFATVSLMEAQIAGAQPETANENKTPGSTTESIHVQLKAKIAALAVRKEVDEATKTQLSSLYQSAQDNLTSVDLWVAKTAQFEASVKNAPEKTKKLQQEAEQLQQKNGSQKDEGFSRIPLEELEQRLILENGKLVELGDQIKTIEKDIGIQNDRPQLIREEMVLAQQAIDVAQKKLDTISENPGSVLLAEANQLQLKTFVDAKYAELKMLASERDSNFLRLELLKAELQLSKLQKDQLDPIVGLIERSLNERKQQEAILLENELTQAEKSASSKHKLIRQITRENIQLSRDLQAINGKIEAYGEINKKAEAATAEIEADFKNAEKKIKLAGLSPILGKVLREQRRNLFNKDRFTPESDTIQNEMAITSLEQFKVEDKLKQYLDLDAYLQGLIARQVEKTLPSDKRMMVQAELRVLLGNQRELLNKLSIANSAYLRMLGDFDFAKQQLLTQANKFAEYLDERLLWVPSSAPINSAFFEGLYESAGWLLSPHNGYVLIENLASIALQNKLLTLVALASLLVLPRLKSWAKGQLKTTNEKSEKLYTDSFSNTLKAFAYTLILVLPLPLFCFLLGWCLAVSLHVSPFGNAVGVGLQSVAIPLFALQGFYRLFSPNGIAIKHFQWQKHTAQLLRSQVAWMRFVIVPCVFIINATGASDGTTHSDSLGRLALIVGMSAISVFFARLLQPSTGLLQGYIKAHPDDGFSKLRFIWYPTIILVPLVVIGFATAGYYLSALELQQKLVSTLRLVFGIVIVYGLILRWLTLVNRELAIKNAKQKRKAALLERQANQDEEDALPSVPVEDQLVDIPTINAQTLKLLVVFIGFSIIIGVWMIWSNILPAFSFLDHIVLWQHLDTTGGQGSYQPVTLTNVFLAGLFLFIIAVSVRNFPGLMELLIFSRLSVEAGGRYAINQLARYFIIAIGLVCIANELGGSWSQVQWLVAALSVGLGFGLQEIFANLVSGIILLFERPIRVGDTVTINEVTGKVSRIQMRATTIVDFEHKESIVPNKTFITTQFVNWTLSDTITRILIPVGIALGSDAKLAHALMLEAARTTPLVLEDPAPSVVFAGIKESAYEFSITVFVSELSHRLKVTHNLHLALEKTLRENDIEFPYPQREVHACVKEKGG